LTTEILIAADSRPPRELQKNDLRRPPPHRPGKDNRCFENSASSRRPSTDEKAGKRSAAAFTETSRSNKTVKKFQTPRTIK
jgi:hypothetical protein